jgi:transcriptional regulator with XRE-family HTH domain
MGRNIATSGDSLLTEVRARLGISQADLARLLGVGPAHVAHAETGTRPLSAAAWPRLRALEAALRATPAPLPPTDWQPLRRRHAQCIAQVRRLALQLDYRLPGQASVARTRLGAAAALPAALAAVEAAEPLPPRTREDQLGQLSLLLNAAHNAWEDGCGPAPTALLRARLAGLLAEATALSQALAEAAAVPA